MALRCRVRILAAHLQDFRNIALARLVFEGGDAFLLGANAQGKTAVLEACGLLTALRSFRTSDLRALVRHESSGEAALRLVLEHEQWGEVEVEFRLRGARRQVLIDGERVERQRDFVGRFPAVPICSDDLDLVRGGPGERRRFLDLLLAGTSPFYYDHLRAYTQLLRERNALLKQERTGPELAAFDLPLAKAGAALVTAREAGVAELAGAFGELYGRYAPAGETVGLTYRPSLEAPVADGFREALEGKLKRDLAVGATLSGPHRDDLELSLGGRVAREFASEGQQRSLVLALRLAAFQHFQRQLGVTPVVLADDVLNELDGRRRELFWSALGDEVQVIATGTERPRGARPRGWQVWRVEAGTFAREEAVS
ncbi:MAG: DNA replication/repair protein RecF [Opitutales bacterium]